MILSMMYFPQCVCTLSFFSCLNLRQPDTGTKHVALYQVGGNIMNLGGLLMGWSTKSKLLSFKLIECFLVKGLKGLN